MEGWLKIPAIAAAIFFSLLLALIVFLSWRLCQLQRRRTRDEALLKSRQVVHPNKPEIVVWPTESPPVNCVKRSHSPSKPWYPHLEILKQEATLESSDTDLDNSDNGGSHPNCINGGESSGWSLSNSPSPSPPGKELPIIEFTVMYVTNSNTLYVHLTRVASLPARYRENCSSYVKVSLLSRKKSSQQTQVRRKSRNPEYDQSFTFPVSNVQELQQSTLRFVVYVKKFNLLKDKRIGVVIYPLHQIDLVPDAPISCLEKVIKPMSKKKMRSKEVNMGQLFLLLQYQASADRLKVLVRKAENIPRPSGMTIVQPEYYVIISLLQDIEAVSCKETKPSPGPNPIWNQPFLFDVPSEKAHLHWLQFLVMHGRMYSRDCVVGHVLVGPDTTPSGTSQWNETMESTSLESARWHNIYPVDIS